METALHPEVQRWTVDYLPDRPMDVHAHEQGGPVVLLWHGRATNQRKVLRRLAELTASAGLVVFVPDWRANLPDSGRSELLASIDYVQQHLGEYGAAAEPFVLAGWSLGGKTAASVMLRTVDGWRPSASVSIASRYSDGDPIHGVPPIESVADARDVNPMYLIHGVNDGVTPVQQPRLFVQKLQEHGIEASLRECSSDHHGVVMTQYHGDIGLPVISSDPERIAAGRLTAATISEAAGLMHDFG